jgi:hypothetical protein
MNVLLGLGVVFVPEPHRPGELLDRGFISGKKVPASVGSLAPVKADVNRLLGCGKFSIVVRVEAHR